MLNAFVSDNGHLRCLDRPSDPDLSAVIWIDLLDPTPEETAMAARATGFEVPTQASVSEIETSSRLASRNGTLYLSMPMVSMADGPRGVAAGFVVSAERLLTVRFAESRVFNAFMEHMPRGDTTWGSAAEILAGLLEAIVDRLADGLEQVAAELDAMSHRIFALGAATGGRKQDDATLRHTLAELGRIGDLISHIRESQSGAARLVPYIETAAAAWLPVGITPRLHTLLHDTASIGDFDTHLNDKLQFLLDATLGFISIAQNNVMKVMTIASVVGIPPVLVAGIYGMNFKFIPEYDWQWGYAFGLALIAVTTIIPLLIFRWRNWI